MLIYVRRYVLYTYFYIVAAKRKQKKNQITDATLQLNQLQTVFLIMVNQNWKSYE